MTMNLFLRLLTVSAICFGAAACSAHGPENDDSQLNSYLKQQEAILSIVKDYAGARKAAQQLNKLKENAPQCYLLSCDPRMARLNELTRKLDEAYYYGCPALAKAMGEGWEDAIIPTPISSAKRKQLEKSARSNLKAVLPPEHFALVDGGAGFSAESAWVLRTKEPGLSYELCTRIALHALGDTYEYKWREVLIGERRFSVYTVTLLCNGKKHLVEQWVDCTASKKVYPEPERKAAMQELLNRYRQIHRLLMSIDDEDSAREAMAQIEPLVALEEHEKLCDIAEMSYTIWGFFSFILTKEELQAYILKEKSLEEADYYGVKSLQELLYSPPCQ